ncbi:MAG: hypothetical protein R3247_17110 [Rhodothermales bacterium]|nr:hypothetical protein [Rhodothermales bacterium]
MPFRPWCTPVSILLLSLVVACSLVEPDRAERTLPKAAEYELKSLMAVKYSAPAPGRYNVEAYVVTISECPKDARCAIPDGITVAEHVAPDLPEDGLRLSVREPDQFKRWGRYIFSVRVVERTAGSGDVFRDVQLEGYSKAK